MSIKIVVHTLENRGRANCVDKLSSKIPNLEIYESVNGYDVTETRNNLKSSGLVYHQYLPECYKCFRNYGTVACFLTKFNILQRQLEERTEFVCLIEDDVEVGDGFVDNVRDICNILDKNSDLTSARMTTYSAVLIFPLSGAERIVSQMKKFGIMKNIDDQIINHNPKCFNASNGSGVSYAPAHKNSLLHKTESFDAGELHNFSL